MSENGPEQYQDTCQTTILKMAEQLSGRVMLSPSGGYWEQNHFDTEPKSGGDQCHSRWFSSDAACAASAAGV